MAEGGEQQSTVLTAWTSTLLRALDDRGIDGGAVAATAGITSDLLDDPDKRVPLHLQTRLWRAAVDSVGDDAFGIEVSRHVRAGSFHALGHAFLSSPTLRSALERAARFSRVTSDIAVGSTDLVGSDLVFTVSWRNERERPAWESVDAVFASIVRTARHLLCRTISPTRVILERPQPANSERFNQFFGCTVGFDAPASLLAFDRGVAERPVHGGNDRLASASDQAVAAYLSTFDPGTIVDQVRVVLVDAIAAGEPDIAAIARELAMSPRSLQRRLTERGTTFRNVLADTRRAIADSLLAGGTTVTQTAQRLGFSATAAFSRAYRRWTGSAPSRNNSATA